MGQGTVRREGVGFGLSGDVLKCQGNERLKGNVVVADVNVDRRRDRS